MSISKTEMGLFVFGIMAMATAVLMDDIQCQYDGQIALALGLVGATSFLAATRTSLKNHKAIVIPFVLGMYMMGVTVGNNYLQMPREVFYAIGAGAFLSLGIAGYQFAKAVGWKHIQEGTCHIAGALIAIILVGYLHERFQFDRTTEWLLVGGSGLYLIAALTQSVVNEHKALQKEEEPTPGHPQRRIRSERPQEYRRVA